MITPRKIFVLGALFASALLFAPPMANAQDDTVVVGSVGSSVQVDLSVIDDIERGYGQDALRFPGSAVSPGEAIRLHPPGSRPALKRPSAKKKTVRRKAPAKKKAAPAPAPSDVASAPAPAMPAPAMPAPEATAPPRAVTEAPAVPPPPAMDRADVPPPPAPIPPEPPKAPASTAIELPPVTPAPRGSVATAKVPPPPAASAPEQTAALPKPPAIAPGVAGATRSIAFAAGTANLPADAEKTLASAVAELKANPALRVQLRAYAAGDKSNESQARRLSLSRALAVRSWLVGQGVQATRIDVRALGNNVPDGTPDRVDVSLAAR
jgi:outer membrane protein OmpA-like peptidoglycan-associated protein